MNNSNKLDIQQEIDTLSKYIKPFFFSKFVVSHPYLTLFLNFFIATAFTVYIFADNKFKIVEN